VVRAGASEPGHGRTQAAVRDVMTSEIQALADRQWHDYRTRQPGTCFADPGFALDLSDAYALQDAVAALRVSAGDQLIGYKVGCTGAGTVQQFGMEGPIRGCLFGSEVRQHRCAVTGNEFANLAIEGEMAVRIGADGMIAAAFPVIELHHFVFRGTRKTLPELIANNGLNGGFVLPSEAWHLSREYTEQPGALSIWINDRLIASGALWPMQGGVSASLGWLREHLAKKNQALLPGQIVLAGTPLGLYPVRAGDRIVVCVDGRMGVECTIL
jgi:2-keto-4-pentenoate hydratase